MKTLVRNRKLYKNAWDIVPRQKWFQLQVRELPRHSITYDVARDRVIFSPSKCIIIGPFELDEPSAPLLRG